MVSLWLVCLMPKEVLWAQQNKALALAQIRAAYEALDFVVAEARITDALEAYQQFEPRELSEIHVLYALVLFARGDAEAAASQLDQALQLTPSLELDPLDTPPQLLSVFKTLQEDRLRQDQMLPPSSDIRYLVIEDRRADAALRSMVLPGWGQMHKGERKKGSVVMGLWLVTAGGSLVAHIQRNQAKDHYDASTTQAQTQARFEAFSDWHKVRNNLLLGAAGVWAFGYIDTILSGRADGRDLSTGRPFQMSVIPVTYRSPHVLMTWRF